MSSFPADYAQAAADATAEAPGVVYVGAGMYRLTASVAMLPNVKVLGGYGGRTVISGDSASTARAAFWSKNLFDSVYVSKPGITKTPVWNDDLTYNEPNPENLEAWYCTWYGNSPQNAQRGFVNTTSDIGENRFENVTFTLFRYGAFQFSSGKLVLKNCTFVGDCCNALTEGVASVAASGSAGVEVTSCEFVGCAGCLRLTGTGVSSVVSTTFRENCYNSVVNVGDTHRLTVSQCVFSRNWAVHSGTYGRAVVKLESSNLGNLIADSVFTNNFAIGASFGAVYLSGATNRIQRCRFVCNRNMDWSYDYTATNHKYVDAANAACLRSDSAKYGEIRGCSFVGNELRLSSSSTTDAALLSYSTSNHSLFYNCNVSDNVIVSAGSGNVALVHRFNGDLAFVQTIICGNAYTGVTAVPFYSSYNGGNNPYTIFCNTIFDEAGFVGSPFRFLKPSKGAPILYASVVKGFDATYFDPAATVIDSYFTSACVAAKGVSAADGRIFRRLAFSSPYRKAGYPLYVNEIGVPWVYLPQTDKWRRFDTWSMNYKPDGVVLGGTTLSYDVLGVERKYQKVAPGAANAEVAGLCLLIR